MSPRLQRTRRVVLGLLRLSKNVPVLPSAAVMSCMPGASCILGQNTPPLLWQSGKGVHLPFALGLVSPRGVTQQL